jgi:hypothetical protein
MLLRGGRFHVGAGSGATCPLPCGRLGRVHQDRSLAVGRYCHRFVQLSVSMVKLVRPHTKVDLCRIAENGRKRSIHRVKSMGNAKPTRPVRIKSRIKGMPGAAQEYFAIGMEVYANVSFSLPQVGNMASDVTCGQIECAA